jgi:hypothetical protein
LFFASVYKQVEDEELRRKQEKFMKVVGFTFPVFYGRGIFQYSFGLLPVRKPLIVVGMDQDGWMGGWVTSWWRHALG